MTTVAEIDLNYVIDSFEMEAILRQLNQLCDLSIVWFREI